MSIYVNTDNSDAKKKLFNASGIGNAAIIEKKMQEVVIQTIREDTAADFNTDTPGKGYSLRMKVVTETSGRSTTYTIKIEIIRYPLETVKGKKAEHMVPITVTPGRATLDGASDADMLEAIALLTKKNVKAALVPMKVDMARR